MNVRAWMKQLNECAGTDGGYSMGAEDKAAGRVSFEREGTFREHGSRYMITLVYLSSGKPTTRYQLELTERGDLTVLSGGHPDLIPAWVQGRIVQEPTSGFTERDRYGEAWQWKGRPA